MKRFFLLFIPLILANFCTTEATEEICNSSLDEKQQISFYRGYLLWQGYLQKPGMPYDFEQLIAGMRAAQNGENLACDEDSLQKKILEFQENLHAKQAKENLIDAEAFLSKMKQEGASELVSNKLYYKILKIGEGKTVQPIDVPMLSYTVWTYNRWGEQEVISFDAPHPVMLEDTIPGFAQGVIGMLEGEIRQLFIHPDLAYGTYGKFDPNLLIIFKIEVVSKNAEGETH